MTIYQPRSLSTLTVMIVLFTEGPEVAGWELSVLQSIVVIPIVGLKNTMDSVSRMLECTVPWSRLETYTSRL